MKLLNVAASVLVVVSFSLPGAAKDEPAHGEHGKADHGPAKPKADDHGKHDDHAPAKKADALSACSPVSVSVIVKRMGCEPGPTFDGAATWTRTFATPSLCVSTSIAPFASTWWPFEIKWAPSRPDTVIRTRRTRGAMLISFNA